MAAIYPADGLKCRDKEVNGQGCLRGYTELPPSVFGAPSDGTSTGYRFPTEEEFTASTTMGLGIEYESFIRVYVASEVATAQAQIVAPAGYRVLVSQNDGGFGRAWSFNEAQCELPDMSYIQAVVATTGGVSLCG